MSTLHQVAAAKNGESFMSLGPVDVHRQLGTKIAKNGKLCTTLILKSTGHEVFLTMWDEAAKWRLPEGIQTLRGKFVKGDYRGKASLQCETLTPPEGAVAVKPEDIQAPSSPAKMKDCLDAGIRAADYMIKKDRPELCAAAFAFAANGLSKGIQME